jgi:penicillin-binding protein 2
MDVRTGRIIALASYPTYNPSVWIGGISQAQYNSLTSQSGGEPLVSRAIAGDYAPGSTFKITTTSAALENGYGPGSTISCPSSFSIGGRTFGNFEGESGGALTLRQALIMSCDTVFYQIAYRYWQQEGGVSGVHPRQLVARMADAYGFNSATGVDLPGESTGRIPDRDWYLQYWKATKAYDCAHGKSGFPALAKTNPSKARYLTSIAQQDCASGYVYVPGDAANLAIGQGDVLVTPLQLARAYAALANGGTLFSPKVGEALVTPSGKVVRRIDPQVVGHLPVPQGDLAYIRSALEGVTKSGTAAGAFGGFPFGKVDVAGKTGTAEVYGRQDTSWFASFAPANNPEYATVVMVSQAGQGASVAAPAVRQIWDGIFGLEGHPAAFPGGTAPAALPRVTTGGT